MPPEGDTGRDFFAETRLLFAVAEPDGALAEVNPSWSELLGDGGTFLERVHPDTREAAEAAWARVAAGGESEWSVDRVRSASGDELWLSWSVTRTISGRVLHVGARDVTNERGEGARGPAADTRMRLERIFDAVAEGIWVLDAGGRTVLINPAAEAMTGFSREEILGEVSHFKIHHTRVGGEPYPIEECPIYRSVFHGEPCEVDHEVFWRKDGTSFPVHYKSTPVVGPSGEALGAVQVFRDVTESRSAADERERFVQLIENSRDFIGVATLEGSVFFVNAGGRELVGLPAEGAPPANILEYLTPESQRRLLEHAFPAVLAEDRWTGSGTFRDFADPDHQVEVDISLFLVRDREAREPLCIATIARDSSERLRGERIEQQLVRAKQLQDRAIQLNDDVVQGLIVAKMSYELGETARGTRALTETLNAARRIVGDLLAAATPAEGYAPGDLVRTRPAGPGLSES